MNNISLKSVFAAFTAIVIGFMLCYNSISIVAAFVLLFLFFLTAYLFQKNYETILKFMILVVFFVPFNYFRILNVFNFINFLTLFGCVLGMKFFYNTVILKKEHIKFNVIDKLYFLFLLSAGISSCFAKSILGSLNWIFYSMFTGFLVYKAIVTLNSEVIGRILKFFIIVATVCAVEGIGEYLINHSIIFGGDYGRLTSLLGHPLVNGIIFSITLPLSIGYLLMTKEKKFIITSLILFIAIVLTFSRGSWLSLGCGFVFMFFFLPLKEKVKISIMILLIAALGIIPIWSNVKNRVNTNESSRFSSFNVRLKSIPVALEIIKNKPFFGGGPFNSIRYKDEYAGNFLLRKTSFENSYLGLIVDLGIIGSSILMAIYLLIFISSIHRLRLKGSIFYQRLAITCGLLILLINMATFNFDASRTYHFVVWFYLGLASSKGTGNPVRQV